MVQKHDTVHDSYIPGMIVVWKRGNNSAVQLQIQTVSTAIWKVPVDLDFEICQR